MAGDGDGDPYKRRIQEELCAIATRRIEIDREIDRLLQAQPSSSRMRDRIGIHLRRLLRNRGNLDEEETELRNRVRDGLPPAGSPASSSHETWAEEHTGKVSSSELRGTSMDLSNFEALRLSNDASQTVELESIDRVEENVSKVRSREPAESADKVVMHADTVESGMLDSKIVEPSAVEKKKPCQIPRKYWPPKNEGDISFAERQAEKEYEESQAQLRQARGQYTYASKEEIARNAKKWMSEEAMVAFRRYIGSEDHLKEFEYEFEELLHQCFSVEHYFKIFHHFNFTVKVKKSGSTDWTLMTCFAEVKSILQTKHYVCYILDPDENGRCYGCQNQGMHELRHPSVDIFECGNEDISFPYYCDESDSDESNPIVGGYDSEDDISQLYDMSQL